MPFALALGPDAVGVAGFACGDLAWSAGTVETGETGEGCADAFVASWARSSASPGKPTRKDLFVLPGDSAAQGAGALAADGGDFLFAGSYRGAFEADALPEGSSSVAPTDATPKGPEDLCAARLSDAGFLLWARGSHEPSTGTATIAAAGHQKATALAVSQGRVWLAGLHTGSFEMAGSEAVLVDYPACSGIPPTCGEHGFVVGLEPGTGLASAPAVRFLGAQGASTAKLNDIATTSSRLFVAGTHDAAMKVVAGKHEVLVPAPEGIVEHEDAFVAPISVVVPTAPMPAPVLRLASPNDEVAFGVAADAETVVLAALYVLKNPGAPPPSLLGTDGSKVELQDAVPPPESPTVLEGGSLVGAFDASGKPRWLRRVARSAEEKSFGISWLKVALDEQGGVLVVGAANRDVLTSSGYALVPPGDAFDAFAMRLDVETGELLWSRTYGGPGEQYLLDVAAGEAPGEMYVAGYFFDGIPLLPGFEPRSIDAVVARLDALAAP